MTRHSNNPPVRRKGSTKRFPSADGDVKIAFTLAKRHSDAEDSQSAFTERRESEKLGTHLTSLRVSRTLLPELSEAVIGRSPMTVQLCGRPSMPTTRSSHGLTFTRSDA
eukprot:4773158-Pleurochrysis_carterae.AAC.1